MNLQKPVTDQTLLLSKEEAGRLLAVSTRTIDRLLQDGVLPAVRLRRRILVSREAILALVRGEQE
ncbi:MAG: excisionase family DNA-binding protein [Acidobacteriia bacterium]|nr:excisionase family DNA-binding protein [Terriglobia bacterium]